MASEVTGSKSQAARANFADNLPTESPRKGSIKGAKLPSGGDFLKALDSATDNRTEKSGTERSRPRGNGDVSRALEAKDLSRIKSPITKPLRNNSDRSNAREKDRINSESQRDSPDSASDPSEGVERDNRSKERSKRSTEKATHIQNEPIKSAPIIAFLTGHLEQLDPSEIPQLVTDSPFLQNAMNTDDLSAFMQTPMNLQDLLDSLDLTQEDLRKMQSSGLDFNQTVSPADFFKNLGINPQRITIEIELLHKNLGIEGVAAYMQRAMMLSSQKGTFERDKVNQGPSSLRDGSQISNSSSSIETGLDTLGIASGSETSPSADFLKLQNIKDSLGKQSYFNFTNSPEADFNKPGYQLEYDVEDRALDSELGPQSMAYVLAAGGLLQSFEKLQSLGFHRDDVIKKADLLTSTSAENGFLMGTAQEGPISSSQSSGPTMNQATFDAWHTLGDTLRGIDTVTLTEREIANLQDSNAQMSRASAPDSLKYYSDQVQDGALRAPWLAAKENGGPFQSSSSKDELSLTFNGGSSWQSSGPGAVENFGSVLLSTQRIAVNPNGGSVSSKDNISQAFSEGISEIAGFTDQRPEEVRLERFDSNLGKRSDSEGERQNQNLNEREGSIIGEKSSGFLQTSEKSSLNSDMSFGSSLATGRSESPMSSAQRAHFVQQVIDRATVLSQQGGGNVRLDLSSAELGRMEIAVEMEDDRLNLRVLTGSEGIRSALLGDMSKLRELLGQQNVLLGQIEVGVAGEQLGAGTQGFNGQSSFDQRREFVREDIMRQALRGSSTPSQIQRGTAEISANKPTTSPGPVLSNGRIALRV